MVWVQTLAKLKLNWICTAIQIECFIMSGKQNVFFPLRSQYNRMFKKLYQFKNSNDFRAKNHKIFI